MTFAPPDPSSFGIPPQPEIPTSGDKITVDKNEKNAISKALSKAQTNSIIVIPEGEYQDNVVVDKRVTIVGEGKVTIIPLSSNDTFIVDTNTAFFQNLTITSGWSQAASAINLKSGTLVCQNCFLSSNAVPPLLTHHQGTVFLNQCQLVSESSHCLRLSSDIKVSMTQCQLQAAKSNAIFMSGSSIVLLKESAIQNCLDTAIVSLDESSFFLEQSQIVQCKGNGIEITSNGPSCLKESAISQTEACGIIASGEGSLIVYGTTISDCHTCISVSDKYNLTVDTCQIVNARVGALIQTTNGAVAEISQTAFQGVCLAAISADASQVNVNACSVTSLTGTGVAITKGGSVTINGSQFQELTENCIEVSEGSHITVNQTNIATIDAIGLYLKDNSEATLNTVVIQNCAIVCAHIIDSNANISFEQCVFSGSAGNGINIKNAHPSFVQCKISGNQYAGLEVKGETTTPQFTTCEFSQNLVVGANVIEAAKPSFNGCTFFNNNTSGVAVIQAEGTFTGCGFMSNQQMGICAMNGAVVYIEKSALQENTSFGLQATQQNTLVTLKECELSKHAKTGCIIISENAQLNIIGCSIHDNLSPQLESRQGAKLHIEGCEIMNSNGGIGVTVSQQSLIEVVSSFIHDEKQAGIVIGTGGNCNVQGCDIYNCESTGIYFLQGSAGVVTKNKIHNNGVSGVQIMSGSPTVTDNTIENHQAYGIYIAAGASPTISGNQFANNPQTNVFRA